MPTFRGSRLIAMQIAGRLVRSVSVNGYIDLTESLGHEPTGFSERLDYRRGCFEEICLRVQGVGVVGLRPNASMLGSSLASKNSLAEREEISRAVIAGRSIRSVAARLGRAPSTISREVRRNGGRQCYQASQTDQLAWERAWRPKACKLVRNRALAQVVASKLRLQWSPEQIAGWLKHVYAVNKDYRASPRSSKAPRKSRCGSSPTRSSARRPRNENPCDRNGGPLGPTHAAPE
ncbi:Helix-turn-helix domain protein [compost metagenome]